MIASNDFYNNPNRVTLKEYTVSLKYAEARGELKPHDTKHIIEQAKLMVEVAEQAETIARAKERQDG